MISKATSLTEWRMGKIELQILIVIQYEIRNMSTSVIKFTYAKAQWRVWNATNALPLRAAALPLRCRCAAAALPPRCRRAVACGCAQRTRYHMSRRVHIYVQYAQQYDAHLIAHHRPCLRGQLVGRCAVPGARQ